MEKPVDWLDGGNVTGLVRVVVTVAETNSAIMDGFQMGIDVKVVATAAGKNSLKIVRASFEKLPGVAKKSGFSSESECWSLSSRGEWRRKGCAGRTSGLVWAPLFAEVSV